MVEVSDEQFEQFINESMDELPQEYIKNLNNVAVVYEDKPSAEQRVKLKLRCDQSLYGLYEGIPRNQRNNNYSMVAPDKITIFKHPMIDLAQDLPALKKQVKRTLWHEIAHHYGLNHDRIHELERKHL